MQKLTELKGEINKSINIEKILIPLSQLKLQQKKKNQQVYKRCERHKQSWSDWNI